MAETTAPIFDGVLEVLEDAIGATFGPSLGFEMSQARIDQFADATDDHQWIHVDARRAAAGPFGTTIAHGYLTLSLIPHFLAELVTVRAVGMGVNYGLNKVRFPTPVPSGAQLTATVSVDDVRRSSNSAQVTFTVRIDADSATKPVCVAEVVVLYAA